MFRTLIIGFGALIVGLLAYLYCELSDLRQALETKNTPSTLVLHAGAPKPGELGSVAQLRLQENGCEVELDAFISADTGRLYLRLVEVSCHHAQQEPLDESEE